MPEPLRVPAGCRLRPEFCNGLVGHWKMNVGGVLIPDLSGNGNHGTRTNMDNPPTALSGWAGQGDILDGMNDYVGNNAQLVSVYPFTMSAWFNTATAETATTKMIFTLVDKDVQDIQYGIGLTLDNKARVAARDTTTYEVNSVSAVNDGKWHLIVGVYVSNTVKHLYLDGVFIGTLTTSVTYNSAVDRFSIGRYGDSTPGQYFPGLIDDVRIFSRALSADEVMHSYAQQEDEWDLGLDDDIDVMQGIPQKINAYKQMRA